MTHETAKLWAVHSEQKTLFLNDGVIGLDGPGLGDLSRLPDNETAFREHYAKACPDENSVRQAMAARTLRRLVWEIHTGDSVVFLHGQQVHLGTVSGEYACHDGGECPHQRPVQWRKHLPRAHFSSGALREISVSPVALFAVKQFTGEFLDALGIPYLAAKPAREAPVRSPFTKDPAPSDTLPASPAPRAVREDPAALRRYILERLERSPHAFRDFIAGLLRAMGYEVRVSETVGASDLTAVRDELLPRIQIRVSPEAVRESDVRALERAAGAGGYGLIFTLAEFPEETRWSLDAVSAVRGIGRAELAGLILKYYDRMEEKYQRMIPLRKTYFPAT